MAFRSVHAERLPGAGADLKTTSSTISEVVNIESIIKVSSSELIANKRYGSPITATFSCEDTDNFPNGESAYFWLDPENKASSLPDFIGRHYTTASTICYKIKIGGDWPGDAV